MEERDKDSFQDYAYKGLDAILKFTAKAGDSLKAASNIAIEKIDAFQLERKAGSLYDQLGRIAFSALCLGTDVTMDNLEVAKLVEELDEIVAELNRRGISMRVKK